MSIESLLVHKTIGTNVYTTVYDFTEFSEKNKLILVLY